jgi:hypothetical protein
MARVVGPIKLAAKNFRKKACACFGVLVNYITI